MNKWTYRTAFWLCTVDRVQRLACLVRPCWRHTLWTNTRRLQTSWLLWIQCSRRRRCRLWATSVETRHAFQWCSWWWEIRRPTPACPTSPWCSLSSSPWREDFEAPLARLVYARNLCGTFLTYFSVFTTNIVSNLKANLFSGAINNHAGAAYTNERQGG